MEKNKITYFPLVFFPPFLEMERLQELQFRIKHTVQEIERAEKTKYNIMIRKQGLANRLRSHLHIVKSGNTYTEQFIKGDNARNRA